jgi:hypothetical protein
MLKTILVAILACSLVKSEYTSFKWSTCNTQTPGFTINQLDIKPMVNKHNLNSIIKNVNFFI